MTLNVFATENNYTPTPANPEFRTIQREEVIKALKQIKSTQRLLLTDEAIQAAHKRIITDPRWAMYYDALKSDADKRIESSPVEYKLQGIRLLHVSREALKRIFTWSFLYRYTGETIYAKRVEKELLAISSFKDWHPSHFLDVAEMTVAASIGYDSCRDCFSKENASLIKEAIKTKGVIEARKIKGWWKRNTANWNQVCWCGNLYGALAIYDDEEPQEKQSILVDAIQDSLNGITWSMSSYQKDGNYTEGPGYWGYGTGFNILFLGALESALGNDFGLSDIPGFLNSILYYENVFGTTGNAFNYPDSGSGKMFEASAFWYAYKLSTPSIVWNENQAINNAYILAKNKTTNTIGVRSFHSLVSDRLATCALLWGPILDDESLERLNACDNFNYIDTNKPVELGYVGIGNKQCCVALFRTAWNYDAGYLGIKCGIPNAPHGHLDEGSFVYDRAGVRWFVELGPENYNKIEQLGMNLWSMSQESDRWKLFRYNNFGHSVPTINNQLQLVDQATNFIDYQVGKVGQESFAVIDLTPVYKNEAAKVIRKATLLPNGDLVIEDTIEALPNKEASVERRFITTAQILLDQSKSMAVLSLPNPHDNKHHLQLIASTQSDVDTIFSVLPCSTQNNFDAPNPGKSILLETSLLKPGLRATYTTKFILK